MRIVIVIIAIVIAWEAIAILPPAPGMAIAVAAGLVAIGSFFYVKK